MEARFTSAGRCNNISSSSSTYRLKNENINKNSKHLKEKTTISKAGPVLREQNLTTVIRRKSATVTAIKSEFIREYCLTRVGCVRENNSEGNPNM